MKHVRNAMTEHVDFATDFNLNNLAQAFLNVTKLTAFTLLLIYVAGCAQRSNKEGVLQFDRKVHISLERLYTESPSALELAKVSKAILVFPKVTDIGFMLGGQSGEGALIVNNKIYGYYRLTSVSFGFLMFGTQSNSLAMFIMSEEALTHLQKSSSWQFGAGLKTVFANKGVARSGTMTDDIYVFIYGQKGMMLDLGHLKGAVITKTDLD